MSKNENRVPKRRFKEFENADDWEQQKLGELSDVYDGTHQTPNYTDSGVMFLSVENIKNLQSEKYISKENFEKQFKIFPEKGDVLMTRIGDIGTANVVESTEPKAYYVSLALLKHKKLDPYFLKESISSKTVKKELWHRTLHIAFPKKINKNEIASVSIFYPKLEEEQHQIGTFLQRLGNLITLHQRKLEKMKALKKAYLTDMFPAEGECKPKLRFDGFTDDWEQRKFEDFTKLSQGLQIAISKRYTENVDGSKYFYITNEFLNPKSDKKYYIKNPPENVLATRDDILMTRTGNTGKIVTNVSGAYHNNFFKIDFDHSKYDKLFLYYILNTVCIQKEILSRAGTSTIPDLNHSEFYAIKVVLPSYEEQKKIGKYFTQLDNLITLHQRKLEKLQNIKKAYLNEMFI